MKILFYYLKKKKAIYKIIKNYIIGDLFKICKFYYKNSTEINIIKLFSKFVFIFLKIHLKSIIKNAFKKYF